MHLILFPVVLGQPVGNRFSDRLQRNYHQRAVQAELLETITQSRPRGGFVIREHVGGLEDRVNFPPLEILDDVALFKTHGTTDFDKW